MDIDFLLQDTFAAARPQWKLATNLEDAGQAFAEVVAQNYKQQGIDKPVETEEADDEVSSDYGADEDDARVPEMDEVQSSSEEADQEPETEACFYSLHWITY